MQAKLQLPKKIVPDPLNPVKGASSPQWAHQDETTGKFPDLHFPLWNWVLSVRHLWGHAVHSRWMLFITDILLFSWPSLYDRKYTGFNGFTLLINKVASAHIKLRKETVYQSRKKDFIKYLGRPAYMPLSPNRSTAGWYFVLTERKENAEICCVISWHSDGPEKFQLLYPVGNKIGDFRLAIYDIRKIRIQRFVSKDLPCGTIINIS